MSRIYPLSVKWMDESYVSAAHPLSCDGRSALHREEDQYTARLLQIRVGWDHQSCQLIDAFNFQSNPQTLLNKIRKPQRRRSSITHPAPLTPPAPKLSILCPTTIQSGTTTPVRIGNSLEALSSPSLSLCIMNSMLPCPPAGWGCVNKTAVRVY